jgi:hypothetical protein
MLLIELRRLNSETAGSNPTRGMIIRQLFVHLPVLRPSDPIKRLK